MDDKNFNLYEENVINKLLIVFLESIQGAICEEMLSRSRGNEILLHPFSQEGGWGGIIGRV